MALACRPVAPADISYTACWRLTASQVVSRWDCIPSSPFNVGSVIRLLPIYTMPNICQSVPMTVIHQKEKEREGEVHTPSNTYDNSNSSNPFSPHPTTHISSAYPI